MLPRVVWTESALAKRKATAIKIWLGFLDEIIKSLLFISHPFRCSGMPFMIKLKTLSSNIYV